MPLGFTQYEELALGDDLDEFLEPNEMKFSEFQDAEDISLRGVDEFLELEETQDLPLEELISRDQRVIYEWEELTDASDLSLTIEPDYVDLKNTVEIEDYSSKVRSAWDIQSIELLENIEANDFSFEEDLIPEGENTVVELKELDENKKDIYLPLPEKKKKKEELKPEVFVAVLQKGAEVFDLKTKESFLSDRKLIVKAISNVVGGEIIYLFDKKGEKKYKTHLSNIKDIDNFVNLDSNPKLFSEYVPRAKLEGNDSVINLLQSFSLGQEGVRGEYFQTLFNDSSTSGTVNQFDYQVFYNWPIRLKMGLSASFQRGTWSGQTETLDWYSGLYGLALNYPLFGNKSSRWELQLNASKYFLMRAQTIDGNSIRFQGNQFGLDALNVHNTNYGTWFWGVTINQSYYSVKDSEVVLKNSVSPESITTYGLKIGYRTDFEFWRFTF